MEKQENDRMENFIEVKFLIRVKTAMRLNEIQEEIEEDDEGLLDFLIYAAENFSPTNISEDEKSDSQTETDDEIDEITGTENSFTYVSGRTDKDILNEFYEEDHKKDRKVGQ